MSNSRGHISHVRIQKKASGTSSSPEASIKTAATYSPTVTQNHRRDKAKHLCSEWEEVEPLCYSHLNKGDISTSHQRYLIL